MGVVKLTVFKQRASSFRVNGVLSSIVELGVLGDGVDPYREEAFFHYWGCVFDQ